MARGGISRQSVHLPDAASVTIVVDAGRSVSGLLLAPLGARACYVFAHGAGAGMNHPFMAAIAAELATRGISPLCAISSRIWSRAANDRILRGLRMRRFAPRRPGPPGLWPSVPLSTAATPLVGA